MAVTEKALREYLRLPPDCVTVTGEATIDRTVFFEKAEEGGVYVFTKAEDGWLLKGATVLLSDYGITPGESETDITVDFLTYPVSMYINAAKAKAVSAGIPDFQSNSQYDLFIMSLAAMYFDNRGMAFQNSVDAANAQRMIDSFVLELRYAKEDAT